MNVMKFGGTSVGSPARMKSVAALVNTGEPVFVVLSAVSGTTNKLVEIGYSYTNGEKEKAEELLTQLQNSYEQFFQELFEQEAIREEARAILYQYFSHIRVLGRNGFSMRQYKEVLAQGELISTQLFYLYTREQNFSSVLLNALDFMRIDENGEPVTWYIQENLQRILTQHKGTTLFITQGFICRNSLGEIDNLQRGGSDYSASLIGAAIDCLEIQIWTDIDGMHNNDPRIVSNTRPVRQLSFDEAAELAYFGAKILHPLSVNPARRAGIPVRLKNTMEPDAPGTLIFSESTPGEIKAVAAKDGILAIRIVSNRMLLAFGFLRKVFEVFERYKTSIDMITTSEVAVSLTIDNPTYLNEIERELSEFGKVEIQKDLTIICIVGDMVADKPGYADKIMSCLKEVPLRMVSYGGSRNNVSVLIDSNYKSKALIALNEGVFNLQTA